MRTRPKSKRAAFHDPRGMNRRQRVILASVMLIAGTIGATSSAAAFEFTHPTSFGELHGFGDANGQNFEFRIQLEGDPLQFSFEMLGSDGVIVDYGQYGSVTILLDDDGMPVLQGSTLTDCTFLMGTELYGAVLEIHQAFAGDPVARNGSALIATGSNMLAMSLGLVAECGATQNADEDSFADCLRQKRDCRNECENEHCDSEGCFFVGIVACYAVCDIEVVSCGMCSILCPWLSTLSYESSNGF